MAGYPNTASCTVLPALLARLSVTSSVRQLPGKQHSLSCRWCSSIAYLWWWASLLAAMPTLVRLQVVLNVCSILSPRCLKYLKVNYQSFLQGVWTLLLLWAVSEYCEEEKGNAWVKTHRFKVTCWGYDSIRNASFLLCLTLSLLCEECLQHRQWLHSTNQLSGLSIHSKLHSAVRCAVSSPRSCRTGQSFSRAPGLLYEGFGGGCCEPKGFNSCAATWLCTKSCAVGGVPVGVWVCMLCAFECCLVRVSEWRETFCAVENHSCDLEAAGFGKVLLWYAVWWLFHLLSLPRADRKFREGAHTLVWRTKAGCWSFLTWWYSWSAASICSPMDRKIQ